jgi:hypothetical protein
MFALRLTGRHSGRLRASTNMCPHSYVSRLQLDDAKSAASASATTSSSLSTSRQASSSSSACLSLLEQHPQVNCHHGDVSLPFPLIQLEEEQPHQQKGLQLFLRYAAFAKFSALSLLGECTSMMASLPSTRGSWNQVNYCQPEIAAIVRSVNDHAMTTTASNSSSIMADASVSSSSSLSTNLFLEDFFAGIWHMSSTLKKRRTKMNKHKLQKRRKKERRKTKKH